MYPSSSFLLKVANTLDLGPTCAVFNLLQFVNNGSESEYIRKEESVFLLTNLIFSKDE